MSILNVYLDTNLCRFTANGTIYNNYNNVEIEITSVFSDNSLISEIILIEFKTLTKNVLKEYIEDMDYVNNLKGDLLNYLVNDYEIKKFNNLINEIAVY